MPTQALLLRFEYGSLYQLFLLDKLDKKYFILLLNRKLHYAKVIALQEQHLFHSRLLNTLL